MLVSIVERFQKDGERDVDRFARWEAAIRDLREDREKGSRPGPRELPARLDDLPEDQRSEALQDLAAEHLRLGWESGQGTLLETYFTAFAGTVPEWASAESVPADLVEDEFLARYRLPHGDTPALDAYRERFPGRADVMDALSRRFLDGGRFVKLEKRGAGAMGEVWEVFDAGAHARIAVKLPRENSGNAEEILRQFAQEAAVTAGLDHAGIVHLHARRQSDGALLYTMRLVDGETLARRIAHYHRPPSHRTSREQVSCFRELLGAFVSACDVVARAHAGGVLHRDLKPGNVVVEASGEAAILDWGMAKQIAANDASPEGSSPGILAGTPDSMAPEQADGVSDIRTDVFGLGAILYEILTGGPPHAWEGGSRPADWRRIVRQAGFPNPRRLNARTPRALDAICMQALARDPGGRYQRADELARDVRAYLEGKPVNAGGGSVLARLWRRVRLR